MTNLNIYLSNQLGFSEIGRRTLDTLIIPKIKDIGFTVLDPFEMCGKELDFDLLARLNKSEDVKKFWDEFNAKVTTINNNLMNSSVAQCTILDGGHTVDDGVASEIGYFYGAKLGPIFALRSDFRLADNMSTSVNSQILGYIKQSGGSLAVPPNAMDNWFAAIKQHYDSLPK